MMQSCKNLQLKLENGRQARFHLLRDLFSPYSQIRRKNFQSVLCFRPVYKGGIDHKFLCFGNKKSFLLAPFFVYLICLCCYTLAE